MGIWPGNSPRLSGRPSEQYSGSAPPALAVVIWSQKCIWFFSLTGVMVLWGWACNKKMIITIITLINVGVANNHISYVDLILRIRAKDNHSLSFIKYFGKTKARYHFDFTSVIKSPCSSWTWHCRATKWFEFYEILTDENSVSMNFKWTAFRVKSFFQPLCEQKVWKWCLGPGKDNWFQALKKIGKSLNLA